MTDLHVPFAEIRSLVPSVDEDPVDLITRAVEAEVHAGGWDQQAIFGALWSRPDGSIMWRTQAVPAPLLDRPNVGLRVFAEAMERPFAREAAARLITPDFYGWAAVIEGWSLEVDNPEAHPEKVEAAEAAGRTRTIHQHPDRVEIRSVYAATIDGRVIALVRKRDNPPPEFLDAPFTGAVPDALRRLAEAGRVAMAAQS